VKKNIFQKKCKFHSKFRTTLLVCWGSSAGSVVEGVALVPPADFRFVPNVVAVADFDVYGRRRAWPQGC
jgi:hypothetical protein